MSMLVSELRTQSRKGFWVQYEHDVEETEPAVPAQSVSSGPRYRQVHFPLLLQGQAPPVRDTH